ncbi:hypothetical protein [Kitasatospora cineracea]|uniref:hypothetical protein n=1 Tax=Kitasatospora cineracea TaxID=88074 RepID=UPI0036CE2875
MTALAELLANATAGTARLADPTGATASINFVAAARLLTAVADDTNTLSLNADDFAQRTVTAESADAETVIVQVGPLRYLVSTDGIDVLRLCTVAGCERECIDPGSLLTRVCTEHLDVDDSQISNPRGIRAVRLDAWQQLAEDRARTARGDLDVAGKLRDQ